MSDRLNSRCSRVRELALPAADQIDAVDLPAAEQVSYDSLLVFECGNVPKSIEREDMRAMDGREATLALVIIKLALRRGVFKAKKDLTRVVNGLAESISPAQSELIENPPVISCLQRVID